jgi:hypothetical protein
VAVEYKVENNELVVFDGRRMSYRGRPDGYPVEKVVSVPDTRDAIALLSYSTEGAPAHFPNLLRVGPDGAIRWRAIPPDDAPGVQDAWVAVRWAKRGGLSANSWSAYYCRIDSETGAITSATFTK